MFGQFQDSSMQVISNSSTNTINPFASNKLLLQPNTNPITNYMSKVNPSSNDYSAYFTANLSAYIDVQTQLSNIKTLSCFTNLTEIIPSEFTKINSISIECIEKLNELTLYYIKKINDNSTCAYNLDRLNNMFDKHLELITKIYKFNNISYDVSNNMKQINSNLSPDHVKFTFDEIFNRYKLQICDIISDIKMINTYSSLLKK